MPIEFDPIAELVNPFTAAIFAFLAIAYVSFIAYRFPKAFRGQKEEQAYLRAMALVSEILVAVGLIGLLTFAGRAKLESKGIERAAETRTAERRLYEEFSKLAFNYCIQAQHVSPTKKSAVLQETCALWHAHAALYKEPTDWLDASKKFEALSQQATFDAKLAELLHSISAAIVSMMNARDAEATVPLEKTIIARDISWRFVLFCAVIAAVGVGLKCARAGRELRQAIAQKSAQSA